jgi:hypothetical protein
VQRDALDRNGRRELLNPLGKLRDFGSAADKVINRILNRSALIVAHALKHHLFAIHDGFQPQRL